MNKFYLFSFTREYEVKDKGGRQEKFLVVCYPYKHLSANPTDIYNQLRTYFQYNILPDKIVVLCAKFNETEIINLFRDDSELYKYIPLFTPDNGKENISIHSLQQNGIFQYQEGFKIEHTLLSEILNRGLVKIFVDKGGLIVSQSAHHFVFPSGKHSDRFLRPGNVLLEGIHINYIAFALFAHLKGRKFTSIYCDTSSINSLAFAYVILLREFFPRFIGSVEVESFGSYIGFERGKFSAPLNSLFLISSSTSGSIIERMVNDRKQNIKMENISIIYGLDIPVKFADSLVCNLNHQESSNPQGLLSFESYNVSKGISCKFCSDRSTAIDVQGDVFLLEKPSVKGILLSVHDNPTFLKKFSEYFIKSDKKEGLIKCYYKENSTDDKKYEIYLDINVILREWYRRTDSHPFKKIFSKIEKFVFQNIPASTKYLVVLPDQSSIQFAKLIKSILHSYNVNIPVKNVIGIQDLKSIDKNGKGAIVIVSASITTGRNLLYISRALREFEDTYRKTYFTFLSRPANKKHFEFLESNLSLGEFGKGTHKMNYIEQILCAQEAHNTPWHIEKEFLKSLEEFCEDNELSKSTKDFCGKRLNNLNNSGKKKRLTNNLFFPSLTGKVLKINKGFAFAPTLSHFIETSTQADVYFIISTILNELRCSGTLNQSEYVRNLLEPGNFVRFNDGIIQAALLRAARPEELRYDLSYEMALQMQDILIDMINHSDDEHAEALTEFLYAIAIKKLRIPNRVIEKCIKLITEKQLLKKDSILNGLIAFIRQKVVTAQSTSAT
ncbi:MAG: hypothetical protein JWQ27_2325 [Ferruginibacter sp.]|nr:hypothetical protein [Ferruginibacter sp.]